MQYDKKEYLKMYGQLYFARNYETKIEEVFTSGKLPGFYHLSIGQEAIQMGIINELGPNDWFAPHFRSHPAFALRCGVREFTCEMTAKQTGPNHGIASYAHLLVPEKKVGPSNGMLGQTQSIAAGIAQAYKAQKIDGCVVIGCGDGTMQEGVVSEVLNMISAWKLPVAWYVERNDYAISTQVSSVIGTADTVERGKGFGIPSNSYSGDDIILVREVMKEAIERARRGEATISEFRTYRWRGHFVGDPADYRDPAYLQEAKSKHDPLVINRNFLLDNGLVTKSELDEVEKQQMEIINDAFAYADTCPANTPDVVLNQIRTYAN